MATKKDNTTNKEVKQFIQVLDKRASKGDSIDDDSFFWRIMDRYAFEEELEQASSINYSTYFESFKIYYNSDRILKVVRL